MATATATPQITFCPPAPVPHYGLTWKQSLTKKVLPATAASGLSMADYYFMRTESHQQSYARRLDTPEWAVNFAMQRELLTAFLEQRAQIRGAGSCQGTLAERRARAVAKIHAKRERLVTVVGRLCAEYVGLKRANHNPARQKELARQIVNYDKQIIAAQSADGGLGTIARMIFLYYRVGLDSIGVAEELGLEAANVRVTLWRLARMWATITGTVEEAEAAKEQRQAARHHGVKFSHKHSPRRGVFGRPPVPLSAVDVAVKVNRAQGKTLRKVADDLGVSVQKVLVSLNRTERDAIHD